MTLTSEQLWLVESPVLIRQNVTVSVEPGTHIQFFTSDPEKPQSGSVEPYIQVNGTLLVRGSSENPVHIFPSNFYEYRLVEIKQGASGGLIDMEFVKFKNPSISGAYNIKNAEVEFLGRTFNDDSFFAQGDWDVENTKNTVFRNLHDPDMGSPSHLKPLLNIKGFSNFESNFFEATTLKLNNRFSLRRYGLEALSSFNSNVFLKNNATAGDMLLGTMGDFSNTPFNNLVLSNIGFVPISEEFFILEPTHFNGKTYVAITWKKGGWLWSEYNDSAHLRHLVPISEFLGGHPVTFNTDAEYQFITDYVRDEMASLESGNYNEDCDSQCMAEFYFNPGEIIALYLETGWKIDNLGDYGWITNEQTVSELFLEHFSNRWHSSENSTISISKYKHIANDFPPFQPHFALIEIPEIIDKVAIEERFEGYRDSKAQSTFYDNAILNQWWSNNPSHWLNMTSDEVESIFYDHYPSQSLLISNNYWGNASNSLIETTLLDFYAGNFGGYAYEYSPVLDVAPEDTFPFVVDIKVDTETVMDAAQFGAEPITLTIFFNRDMDQSIQPGVFMAPNAPYNDRKIDGNWVSPRIWQGEYAVPTTIENGFQYISVIDAVASNNPWLKSGRDIARFRFTVNTTDMQSSNSLIANSTDNGVALEWSINALENEVINLYRSENDENGYRLIYRTYPSLSDNTFFDENLKNNTQYYYRVSVGSGNTETYVSNSTGILTDFSNDVSEPEQGNGTTVSGAVNYDFDGDQKADIAIRRPHTFHNYILNSSGQNINSDRQDGIQRIILGKKDNDIPISGDFDGDGVADLGVRRESNFTWYIKNSSGNDSLSGNTDGITRVVFGKKRGDIPAIADFDGDQVTDIAVWRPSTQMFYIRNSTGIDAITGFPDGITRMKLGNDENHLPVVADYDGDGKADLAVRNPETQRWTILNSSGKDLLTGNEDGITRMRFGKQKADIPVPADYDGDGLADLAVRRPSTKMWYILNSSGYDEITGYEDGISRKKFGTRIEDIPVVADYDGDGKADIAVRRPSTFYWYILNSSGVDRVTNHDDAITRIVFGKSQVDIPHAAPILSKIPISLQ